MNMFFYLCCRWTLRTGSWVEGWQVWGWSRRRYASSSTLSSWYHASSQKLWTTTSASSSQVSTHTCRAVEEVCSSLPSVLHTITHLCLIDLSHHWSVLFLPSSCSNTCCLKCVNILPFLYLDEPMAHYIISWLRNHKECNDSAFFNMEVFKLFNAKDPQLRQYFCEWPLSENHGSCICTVWGK